MDNEEVPVGENSGDDVARLGALTERQHELWDQLSNCQDEQQRSRLFRELATNRQELARLKETVSHQLDEPDTASLPTAATPESPESVGTSLRASLLKRPQGVSPKTPPPEAPVAEGPSDAADLRSVSEEASSDSVAREPADAEQTDLEPVEPAAETTRRIVPAPLAPENTPLPSREDDLLASRGSRPAEVAAFSESVPEAESPVGLEERRRSAPRAHQDLERIRSGRHGRSLPVVGILVAVGAVAVVASLLFLRPGGSTETAEAATASTIATEVVLVDQIRAVLDGLGYGSVLVEERADTVYLAGILDSDNDRSAAISASQALAGDMPLDSSGLTIAGADDSTDPPTTSVPPADTGWEQPVVVPADIDGPYIEATLDGKDFVLAGVVPSAEVAGFYLKAAEIAYSPYIRSELVVDEQLESPDWLLSGPNAIVLLPMITEGKILIADDQVQMWGQSPNQAGIDRLQGALGQITGLPVVVGDVEITNLQPPSWVIAADAGAVDLSGEVPTEEIRDMLVEGAAAAYGPDNVQDRISVNSNVYPSLWMYSGGPLLQAMSTFPDYELRIDGTAFSGFINGNVTFESGSAIFSGNYAEALDVGVSVLTRDPSLRLVIEGHTDDRGSKAANLALSQIRAEAVRDYFIAGGIDASRLTAIGIGEAEPVVPNNTEAGRARNRRIQYILSTSR